VSLLKKLLGFSWCKTPQSQSNDRNDTTVHHFSFSLFGTHRVKVPAKKPLQQSQMVNIPKANPNAMVLKLNTLADELRPLTGDAIRCAGWYGAGFGWYGAGFG
jgi:hypothetical protein